MTGTSNSEESRFATGNGEQSAAAVLRTYFDRVGRSGLMEPAALKEFTRKLMHAKKPAALSARDLADALQREGHLTAWQQQCLVQGSVQNLRIGAYKVLDCLAQGGFGKVYLAEHAFMKRRVAIKVIAKQRVTERVLQRFQRECQVIAGLDHPNIVKAFDFNTQDQFFYLVMEYVEGQDLDLLVRNQGRLPWRQAANLIVQAASGLAALHSAGVVHRDIKPSNLLVSHEGNVKLLDLGLARVEDEGQASLTVDGNDILGTLDFMAPEQAMDSHRVDGRADQYSLGCTLYYMLTGRVPFPEGTPAQRLMSHIISAPTPISRFAPEVPPAIVDICVRMMRKQPEDRFASCVDLAQCLQECLNQTEIRAVPRSDEILPSRPAEETLSSIPADTNRDVEAAKSHTWVEQLHQALTSADAFWLKNVTEQDLLSSEESLMIALSWLEHRQQQETLLAYLIRHEVLVPRSQSLITLMTKGQLKSHDLQKLFVGRGREIALKLIHEHVATQSW